MPALPNAKLRALGDLALAAAVVGGSATLFVGAASLPPPRFEPLGSAFMPRVLGAVLIVLAIIVALRAALILIRPADVSDTAPSGASLRLPYRGAITLVLLVAYVAAMDFARVPFLLATPLFVMLAGMTIHEVSPRSALVHAALGLVLALALHYVFSTFLFIRIG